jgi:hypothetical protein
MRATVNAPDELLRKAKQLALERHETLGRIIEDALRRYVVKSDVASRMNPTWLTTFKGNGLQPGIDLDNNASLLDVMEGR